MQLEGDFARKIGKIRRSKMARADWSPLLAGAVDLSGPSASPAKARPLRLGGPSLPARAAPSGRAIMRPIGATRQRPSIRGRRASRMGSSSGASGSADRGGHATTPAVRPGTPPRVRVDIRPQPSTPRTPRSPASPPSGPVVRRAPLGSLHAARRLGCRDVHPRPRRENAHANPALLLGLILLSSPPLAQDRDTKVRNDRKAFQASQGLDLQRPGRGRPGRQGGGQAAAGRLPLHPVRGVPGVRRRRGPPRPDHPRPARRVRLRPHRPGQHDRPDEVPARLRPVLRRLPDEPGPDHLRPVRHALRTAGARGHLAGGAPQGDGGGAADAPGLRGGQAVAGGQAGQAGPLQDAQGLPEPLGQVRGDARLRGQGRPRAACTATRSGRPSGWSTARRASRSPTRCSSRTPTRPCWA